MSGGIVKASAGQAAAIELGLRIAESAASAAMDVMRMRAETIEFMKRADTLMDLVHSDVMAAAGIMQPMFTLLLESDSLVVEERLALIEAIRALGEINARARGDAIRELAKKV